MSERSPTPLRMCRESREVAVGADGAEEPGSWERYCWFDAGECATGALAWLRERSEARRVCRIDPEEFFDFQESRPRIEIAPGGERRIRWPEADRAVEENLPSGDDIALEFQKFLAEQRESPSGEHDGDPTGDEGF